MSPSRGREPDISFTSRVRARTVRFHEPPRVEVWFSGSAGFRSMDATEREGLPKPVRAHRTYRNVRVDYRLECALAEDGDPAQPPD